LNISVEEKFERPLCRPVSLCLEGIVSKRRAASIRAEKATIG
jgi:hypothetical protein